MIRSARDPSAGVSTITLDRPERRNALTPDMLTALIDAAERAAQLGDAVLIRGEGPVFCAGFDLVMCQDSPNGATLRLLLTGLSEACRALRALERPVVIAAHGAAIAGGCALLGGADVVVADREATLGYPVVRLGVSPAVSVPFLRLSVGDGRARELTLRPDTVSGARAFELGLVHVLVESPALVGPEAARIAAELAAKPAHAIAQTKRWLNRIESLGRGPDIALEASLALTGGPEERERLAALDLGSSRGPRPGPRPAPHTPADTDDE